MKNIILFKLILSLTLLIQSQDYRDAFVGTYNYFGNSTFFIPPPPTVSNFSGTLYIIKSLSDSTKIVRVDSASGGSLTYTAFFDSTFSYYQPLTSYTGFLRSDDSLFFQSDFYMQGGTLVQRVNHYAFKISSSVSIIESVDNMSIVISPNPSHDIIYFNFIDKIVFKNLIIYDVGGKIKMKLENSNQRSIDVSTLSTGLYFIKIETKDGETGTAKFVKR